MSAITASFRAVRRKRSDRGYAAIVTIPSDEPVGYTEIRALPKPGELWADRGYDGEQLRAQTRQRGVEPVISRRRRAGDPPPPPGTPTIRRGNSRRLKPRDPNARHRWPVERTNSWLRNWRRVATRWEHNPDYWLAIIQTAAAMVAWQMLEQSFR